MSALKVLHTGPCLCCSRPLRWIEREAQSHCFRLPFCSTNFNFSTQQLVCGHCGFVTDGESYKIFRDQQNSGLVSKSFDTSTTEEGSDVSVLTYSQPAAADELDKASRQREGYVSLAGLLVAERGRYDNCRCCATNFAGHNWRFCPTCGVYIEESSTGFGTMTRTNSGDLSYSDSQLL
jgi:hypothetical protein